MVECKICGKEFKSITNTHLKRHNTTIEYYKEKFPNSNLLSDNTRKLLSENCYGNTIKGKTFEEIHGKKKAKELKKKCAWHKGLTKETCESLRIAGEKKSITMKGIWNKPKDIGAWKKSMSKGQLEVWKRPGHREHMSKVHMGYEWSEESLKKLSKSQKKAWENTPVERRRELAKQTKEALAKSTFDFSEHSKNVHNQMTPEVKSEWKEKIRKSAIEYFKKHRKINGKEFLPNIGKNETKALDMMESKLNINITRQFPILQYFVDGYDEINNVVYEVYENHHRRPKNMKKDEIRMNNIIKELNCGFVIINDDQKVIYE